MKNKGFTLIELLAVLVILAIIALIAVPIVLNIISDAKKESNERSIELYASAVEQAVARYQLNNGMPTDFSELTIEYSGNEVNCGTSKIKPDGSIYLADCYVGDELVEGYTYGTIACTIDKQDESKYSIGDIVTCNIGDVPEKFYVIAEAELTASTIQMLTEKNIHITEFRQSDNAGGIEFSSSNYWSNETTYPVDVYDDRNDRVKLIVDEYVNYLNTKLNDATGNLLTYSQATSLGCIVANASCAPGTNGGGGNSPTWVYPNIMYWTGFANNAESVWAMDLSGGLGGYAYDTNGRIGVRPVITISTNEI